MKVLLKSKLIEGVDYDESANRLKSFSQTVNAANIVMCRVTSMKVS